VVVEREEKIRAFKSRDYWELHASFDAQAGSYPGKWFDPGFKKPAGDAADPELKADRLWNAAAAEAIAAAVRGQPAQVSEESKPSTQACGLLYDLTSLQREANGRFGFSAKTTLALAQSLYERHKALTYPRTDSRALPEDYLSTVQQTVTMLAASQLAHLAPHARTALDQGYIRPSKRVFDNSKVSDHFAIIPTLQAPSGLSEAEQKLYDLVARRFLAVFFPPAEFQLTTRISTVHLAAASHAFKTEGKVLLKPGWMAVYGKEAADEADGAQAGDKGQRLVPVQPGETVQTTEAAVKALQTRPPARYNEATLLGAMEGAGKLLDDEELRSAMADKGLGTPATRAAIIEGLLSENYLLREGREIIPTAKAFQLMTLLRGLQVQELCKPELTGQWEHKLALMERGQLSRADFMRQIAELTERMVRQAKEYDRDSVPGDYATLRTLCPNCGGVVRENYRRYACTGPEAAEGAAAGSGQGCGFSFGKSPAGRTFELAEAEALLRDKRIGPLQGFRSKAGWPFVAELALAFGPEEQNWKLEFDFGDDKKAEAGGELADFSAATALGLCPKCASPVYAHGSQYVCSHAVPSSLQAETSCDFKSGAIILQQVIEPEQMGKLLHGGKTDLLQRFVSNKTRRTFKAYLVWDAAAGKVGFEFEPRAGKAGAAKPAARKAAAKPAAAQAETQADAKAAAKPAAARKATARKPAKAVAAEPAAKPVATRKTATRKSAS